MFSQTVRGYGPINHSVIGTTLVIIHPGPLILANVKWFLRETSLSLSSGLRKTSEFVFAKHVIIIVNSVFFCQSNMKAIHCCDGNFQNIY